MGREIPMKEKKFSGETQGRRKAAAKSDHKDQRFTRGEALAGGKEINGWAT